MTGEHGRAAYLVAANDGKLYRYGRDGKIEIMRGATLAEDTSPTETYGYRHIFGETDLAKIPSEDALTDLGDAMHARSPKADDTDRTIPAGYTYLGQFIAHDITYLHVNMANNGRSPALDLDSVLPVKDADKYQGGTPELGPATIGHTSDGPPLYEDIPRQAGGDNAGEPIIADPRNDNFLPLSQCHLLLLKFYNACARWLGVEWVPHLSPDDAHAVRVLWVQHFQAAVLDDYLPRIVGSATHKAVTTQGRIIVHPTSFRTSMTFRPGISKDVDWLPLEFAAALGRYGHSMIRNGYQPWNRLTTDPATVEHFMLLSYRNGGQLSFFGHRIPMRWLTDWLALLDFSGTKYAEIAPSTIMANPIDTRLAKSLEELWNVLQENPSDPSGVFKLAPQTLKRGRWCQLASSQIALEQLNCKLGKAAAIDPLTCKQICDSTSDPERRAFEAHPELFDMTPLWFYMLREAEVTSGDGLGPFGARIVMETLHAAIEASEISILDGTAWTPTLPRVQDDRFTFADLVAFAGDPDPLGSP